MRSVKINKRKVKASKLTPNSYHFSILVCDLDEKNDLETVILGGAYLERALEKSIIAKLMSLNPDFDFDRFLTHSVLKDFEHKITLSFHMGIIGVNVYNQLKIIKEIRNYFAHAVLALDFEHEEIRSMAMNLNAFDIFNPQEATAEFPDMKVEDVDDNYEFVNDNGKVISGLDHLFVNDIHGYIGAYMRKKEKKDVVSSKDKFIYSIQMAWLFLMLGVFNTHPELITYEGITSYY